MLKIGIVPNHTKKNADVVLKRVVKFYQGKNVEIILPRESAEKYGYEQLGKDNFFAINMDLVVTIGGDGTLLNACRKVAVRNIPVCGINIGRLGFLADIELNELESKLTKIIENDYHIEERLMLVGIVNRAGQMHCAGTAINDVVVTKGGVSRMLNLGLSIDDSLVKNYQADGIIVSTATGSTAYSLSAGGPIINPRVKVLLITPICPHTLNARPMIIAEEEAVQIKVAASHRDIVLTFDGQDSCSILPDDEVIVRKSPIAAQIIKFSDTNYYQTMRTKLWRGSEICRI